MIDLYTWPTPNGQKVHIMLEEVELPYSVHPVDITEGAQFESEFLAISPNNKIPVIVDDEGPTVEPYAVFETGAILLYLAEKFGEFMPSDPAQRPEFLSWLFWQVGSTPYLGGGFGHFYHYAHEKYEYPIDRFAMEVKRQLDVLERNLAERQFLCGDDYNIADIATYAWYGNLVLNDQYEATEFLDVKSYKNVVRWAEEIQARPAVQRGRRVNRIRGPEELQVPERHDASDIS